MSHGASPLAAFHLTGDRSRLPEPAAAVKHVRPALFGAYHDLSRLRGDFPLVLTAAPGTGPWVRSLADAVDGLLRDITEPGVADEATRRQVLALEQSIRTLLAGGQRGSLSLFWEAARRDLTAGDDTATEPATAALNKTLRRAWQALQLDGELVQCDRDAAAKLLRRAWQESEHHKAKRLHRRVQRLAHKLADILRVDFMHSGAARDARHLESAVGTADRNVFDFQAMARLLQTRPAAEPLPARRRERIQNAIDTLRGQRFFLPAGAVETPGGEAYGFEFDDCADALQAFRSRLADMRALVAAIAIAELEIDNHYDEARHDRFFEQFDTNRLGPGDLELFPSYLVTIAQLDGATRNALLEILEAGLPFKIVAQTTDILGDIGLPGGQLSFGKHGQHLARMALGLDSVFVLQAPNSSLYSLRNEIMRGVSANGPALFSIYAGADYLASAAASESRAFPCFVYDPAAGAGQAARCSLAGNPQPGQPWPTHPLQFESVDHGRQQEDVAFTFADFVASDPRFAERFACIADPTAQQDADNELTPLDEYLDLDDRARTRAVPYVTLIDADNRLYRAVVDEKLVEGTIRCREAWGSLRELAGIDNSHVAAARRAWEEENLQRATRAVVQPAATAAEPAPAAAAQPAAAAAATPAAEAVEEAAPSSDDPWIETIRCTTCNECTQINDRMFAYNQDKRAYIADPDAGTYRELVQAAETCQVAIIHPGKPRNPDEPGLEELLKRAEPFL